MNIDPKSETQNFDQKVFNHLEHRKEMSTLLNIKSDDDVKQWLESVDETMWEFCTKLRDAILHDPGTKGKMIIGKLLEPVFNDVKTLQSENQRLTEELARLQFEYGVELARVSDFGKINEELVKALEECLLSNTTLGGLHNDVVLQAKSAIEKSKPLSHEQS